MNKIIKAMDESIMSAYRGVLMEQGGPFGAAIIDAKGNTIVVTHNKVLENVDPTAHAEITAIREACKKLNTIDLSDYTMIATGYPCPMCMAAIIWSNIKQVYYGAPAEDCEVIGFRDEPMFRFFRGEETEVELSLEPTTDKQRAEVQKMYLKYAKDQKQMY